MPDDSAGIQLHIHLSRLWVLGIYEVLRTLHLAIKKHDNPYAACLRTTNSKGCGFSSCVLCSIGHLKNETAIARMRIAKGETAGDIKNPPLTDSMREQLLNAPRETPPPKGAFLVDGEGIDLGTIFWFQHDIRIDRDRLISRRKLSDSILHWRTSEADAGRPSKHPPESGFPNA
ncbi:hypothetical protein [uncultured Pseudophaeobacter sp.]|uniref:hypothetical protein n=1 Tax=uncultured Pseudophaeobacter sp. TaxID=1759421 RepID=UPI0025FE3005|nr:hypothetical protein [uncultured Pseudophaeobacter sp.]